MAKYNNELKVKTAKRLKELRESKKLSHAELARLLSEKYPMDISRDVLINYEIAEEYHTKFKAGFGMRIEYLVNIADFYEVSTDYLLGQTDSKFIEPRKRLMGEYSKLEDKAIEKLLDITKDKRYEGLKRNILNNMFTDGFINEFINTVVDDLESYVVQKNLGEFTLVEVYDKKEVDTIEKIINEQNEFNKWKYSILTSNTLINIRNKVLTDCVTDKIVGEYDIAFNNELRADDEEIEKQRRLKVILDTLNSLNERDL